MARLAVRTPGPLVVVAAVSALLACAPAAVAQAPSNDDRDSARVLSALPVSIEGTTIDSTVEGSESPPSCSGQPSGTVWFEITAPAKGRVVVRLSARGRLDAVLDVFRRERSQVSSAGACDLTDAKGGAAVGFAAEAKGTYLLRVSQRANSQPGSFRIDAFVPQPFPSPPGAGLPSRGVARQLDGLANTADAWSAQLAEGTTYRVNLSHAIDRCPSLRIFSPGTTSFSSDSTYTRSCGGYLLLTPGPGRGGRWSFLVQADSGRRAQHGYRLQLGPVGPDDMTPGLRIGNGEWVQDKLQGGQVDKVDVYRFDVLSRSHAKITMHTARSNGFDVTLVSVRGTTISCACGDRGNQEIRKGLHRGRYYVVVKARHRARGDYSLMRTTRRITSARLSVNGRVRARVRRGTAVKLSVRVRPNVSGAVSIVVDRFDPLSGWHFRTRLRTTVRKGTATVSYTAPVIGTWRAYAVFRGSRTAAPSDSRYVRWRVTEPLAG